MLEHIGTHLYILYNIIIYIYNIKIDHNDRVFDVYAS